MLRSEKEIQEGFENELHQLDREIATESNPTIKDRKESQLIILIRAWNYMTGSNGFFGVRPRRGE
jgi:hypothetical protein